MTVPEDSVNRFLEEAKKTIGDELRGRLTRHVDSIVEELVAKTMFEWKFYLERRGSGELTIVIRDNREPPQN